MVALRTRMHGVIILWLVTMGVMVRAQDGVGIGGDRVSPLVDSARAVYDAAMKRAADDLPADTALDHRLSALATTAMMRGDVAASELCHGLLYDARRRILGPDAHATNAARNAHALACFYAGNYTEAERGYTGVLAWCRAHLMETHPDFLTTLSNLALLQSETGRHSLAEGTLRSVIALERRLYGDRDPNTIVDLSNLSLILMKLGRTREAEETSREAMALGRHVLGPTHPDVATMLNNAALLEEELGRERQAEALLQESLHVRERVHGRESVEVAQSLNNVATHLMARGDNIRADSLLQRSAAIVERRLGGRSIEYARILHNRGRIAMVLGNDQRADSLLHLALAIKSAVVDSSNPDHAATLQLIGMLHWQRGRLDSALSILRVVWERQSRALSPVHSDLLRTLFAVAELSDLTGRTAQAARWYSLARSRTLDRIRGIFPGLSENEKVGFLSTVQRALQSFLRFCVGRSRTDPAATVEMGELLATTRGMVLYSTRAMRAGIENAGDSTLREDHRAWRAMREQLARLYTLSPAALQRQHIDVDSVEREANAIEKRLVAASEQFARSSNLMHARIGSWRRALSPDACLLHIFTLPMSGDTTAYFGLLMDRDTSRPPRVVELGDAHVLETTGLGAYRAMMREGLITADHGALEEPANAPRDSLLHALFWQPIEAATGRYRTVHIIPDGVFAQINLLTIPVPGTGGHVLGRKRIRILEHEDELEGRRRSPGGLVRKPVAVLIGDPDFSLALRQPPPRPPEEDSVGDTRGGRTGLHDITDLPGTRAEVEAIARGLRSAGWRTVTCLGAEARSSVVGEHREAALVHIATHGYFARSVPERQEHVMGVSAARARMNPLLRTGLLFAGARSIGGLSDDSLVEHADKAILTAFDVASMSFPDLGLVVLSACETGLGEISSGEGVMGLQRGFRMAGARSLLMSLWNVSDAATRELMTRFYGAWLRHGRPNDALEEAQRELMRTHPHPCHWGAFIVTGSTE